MQEGETPGASPFLLSGDRFSKSDGPDQAF